VHCDVIMAKHCLHQCVLASIPYTKSFQIQRLVVPSSLSIPRAGVVCIRGQGRWFRDCCHAHEFCSGHGFKFTRLKHVVGWDGLVVGEWFFVRDVLSLRFLSCVFPALFKIVLLHCTFQVVVLWFLHCQRLAKRLFDIKSIILRCMSHDVNKMWTLELMETRTQGRCKCALLLPPAFHVFIYTKPSQFLKCSLMTRMLCLKLLTLCVWLPKMND